VSASWSAAGTAGPYSVWKRDTGGGEVYNVTYGGEPGPGDGGYRELESLLRLKGLSADDFVPASGPKPR